MWSEMDSMFQYTCQMPSLCGSGFLRTKAHIKSLVEELSILEQILKYHMQYGSYKQTRNLCFQKL